MEKCSDFLFGPVGHNEMRLGPVCSAAKSCITKHSLTADLIVCRRHCAKTGSYIFAELATDHWSSTGTFSLQMLCLCLKAPRNESHLYNFYSVSSIKVRICGQEYETRLLSRQKRKQWKSKRRNDCSFNCLKSLWANVLSTRLLFAEIVGYLETIVLYSMFSSRQFQTFGFFLFSIFFI